MLEDEDCAVVQEGYFHSVGTFVQTGTGLYIHVCIYYVHQLESCVAVS